MQIQQFSELEKLYSYWNEKINVISRKDIDHLYERHVLHSLAIAKVIEFKAGTQILDIGTGGGFPGLPLAILFPEVDFVLIDSIGKKIKVVNNIIDVIGLKNAIGLHKNSNEIKDKYDFVISRAVIAFPKFINLVKGKIQKEQRNDLKNGILYLKGGDLEEELKNISHKAKLYPIQESFKEEFFATKYVLYFPI